MRNWFVTRHNGSMARQDGLAHVRTATSAAICHMNLESADLRARVDTLGCQLASVLGDLEGIYYEREPEDERDLSILESHFLEASKRWKDLDRQLAILHDIQKLLDNQ
jgi:hypothetical protein